VRATDIVRHALRAARRYPARTGLMLLAMAIGVAAVVLLTALGDGARQFVAGEFASLGTNLVIVLPGRSETVGGSPGMFGGQTPRDLTIADARALERSSAIRRVAPLVVGTAPVSFGDRSREVPILGATEPLLAVRHWKLAQGRFLPPGDPERGSNVCVIGAKVRRELFAGRQALGEWLRIGDRRFRVIGVLATEGRSIGIDVEEVVILPVASAQTLLNAPSLFRILIESTSRESIERVREFVRTTLRARHQGEEDVTVITQDAVLATFDRILRALTLTVAGIAAISLGVAGVLIMNVMLVAVAQRTPEIGLLVALGAPRRQVLTLFLVEATALSLCGALCGLGLGAAGIALAVRLYPTLPAAAPPWAVAAAIGTALATGLAFGLLPARRAAALEPVDALAHR
jgi:putative ABC transport system permease protein